MDKTPDNIQVASAPAFVADEIDLEEHLDVLFEGKWVIAAVIALCFLIGGAYAYLAEPIYRSDTLLHIEDTAKGVSALQELSDVFSEEVAVSAEMELIRSRLVLGQVVDKLNLDVVAHPKYLPIIGKGLARHGLFSADSFSKSG